MRRCSPDSQKFVSVKIPVPRYTYLKKRHDCWTSAEEDRARDVQIGEELEAPRLLSHCSPEHHDCDDDGEEQSKHHSGLKYGDVEVDAGRSVEGCGGVFDRRGNREGIVWAAAQARSFE